MKVKIIVRSPYSSWESLQNQLQDAYDQGYRITIANSAENRDMFVLEKEDE